MATHVSVLMLRSPPGRRDEALAQFVQHRVLEVCRDAVPGFVSGRLLSAQDDDTQACVVCEWTDRAAFEQWMNSPLRRMDDVQRVFEPSGRSGLFVEIQALQR